MNLKVSCLQVLTFDQIQMIYNEIQTFEPTMEFADMVEKLALASYAGKKSPDIKNHENLKHTVTGIWQILALPTIKTVRDAYKKYLVIMERQLG